MPAAVQIAERLGRVEHDETISLAITLPLRNEAQLDRLLTRLYDPADPLYGHYLTSQEFIARFAPTRADYERIATYAQGQGLTVTSRHANRLVLDVTAPAAIVERAFGVHLNHYLLPNGRVFRAPDHDPVVPVRIADTIRGIVGLDDLNIWRPHSVGRPLQVQPGADVFNLQPPDFAPDPLHPHETGSGPGGGLTPSDIKTAYNLNSATLNGSGQTLALFELDGYTASDITHYESSFGLPNVPLQNVLIDGATGAAGSGAVEVTLDIELQIALAPNASKIIVYEGPNSGQGLIDTYNRIATDNLAKTISTSWGLAESNGNSSFFNTENSIFKQMATQGQSIFAAAGDSGAYDNGSTLSVDDPASQPYVTGVGGTKLTTSGAGGAWSSETTWNSGGSGGGGGISSYWAIPTYQSQTGVVTSASGASSTMRNVPDVSLDADPNSGYSIYVKNGWSIYGGTSCGAPLWAAFTALVNQQRATVSKGTLGFANPALYAVGIGANFAKDFHDIADGSTNRYYKAVTGYDLATGWGTFNGINLLNDLAGTQAATGSITGLYNTGIAAGGSVIADSAVEPYFTLTSAPKGIGGTLYITQQHWPIAPSGPWMADSSTSKWISPYADESKQIDPAGNYTYQTTFTVTGDPTAVQITGQLAGDNSVTAIILNGKTVATNVSNTFRSWSSFTVASGFVAGTNTLQFVLNNSGSSPSPSGFRCEMAGSNK
jgi:kumamolisin